MYKTPKTISIRLSSYYRCLSEPGLSDFIRSEDIAKLTGFSAVQIRRDLAYFGSFGVPGKGYSVEELKGNISKILGIDIQWKVALIGIGNLGSALLAYKEFKKRGFEIVAIFDNDRKKIGKRIEGAEIHDIEEIEKFLRKDKIKIGIIATPPEDVQNVVNRLINSGIKTLLNFAPASISVPQDIKIIDIDLTAHLESLAFYLTQERNNLCMEKQENTVLVIDTEEQIYDSCYQDLFRKDYKFIITSDWKHGINLVRKLHPDLALLDPKAAGKEVIRDISLIDPTIIIVETSEHATIGSAVEAMKLGASDFLPKPFTCNELRTIINHGIEKRKLLIKTPQLRKKIHV